MEILVIVEDFLQALFGIVLFSALLLYSVFVGEAVVGLLCGKVFVVSVVFVVEFEK